jgi:erythrocyte band 7 integral membrane protein
MCHLKSKLYCSIINYKIYFILLFNRILTKDSVTVSVDAVVYFRILNAVVSIINVEDAAKSTKLLAATTLRNILGTKSLQEILSDR